LALPEGIDGGDRLDAQLGRDALVLVDIDLDHADLALGGGHCGFQHRAKRLARAAPGGPEIDDDRNLAAGLDHVGHETGLGRVLDQVGIGFRLFAQTQHGRPLAVCLAPI